MIVSEIADILRSRDVFFNVFSRVFVDVPDDHSDELIRETAGLLEKAAETAEHSDFKEGAALLADVAAKGGGLGSYLHDTRLERSLAYTSLFILSGQGSDSVYESVHRSPEKLMKQEPWSEVKAFYQQNGFCRSDGNTIDEDHIAIELQFMGLLSGKAAEACEHNDFEACEAILRAQLEFYEQHMSQWVPGFCTKIAGNKDTARYLFYAAYALILKGFLAEDMLFLKELLED